MQYNNKQYSINNNHKRKNQQHSIILNLNNHFFKKLQQLLYVLKEKLVYDLIEAQKGFLKIKIFCHSQNTIHIIKKHARNWIMYRVKESYQQKIISQLQSKPSVAPNDLTSHMLSPTGILPVKEWKILKCSGDGNCLFRAISSQLYGNQNFYPNVRNEIVKYIQDNRSRFEADVLIDHMTLDEYIEIIKKDGSWGGNTVLLASSELYFKQVFIYNYIKNDDNLMQIQSFHEEDCEFKGAIRLFYNNNHFDSIIKMPQLFITKGLQNQNENFHYAPESKDIRHTHAMQPLPIH